MFFHISTQTYHRDGRHFGIEGLNEDNCAEYGFATFTTEARPSTTASQEAILNEFPSERGGSWVRGWTVTDIPATAEMVTAERDRRLEAGVTVTVTGYGAIPMQGRAQDMINTLSLKDTARDLKAANITAAIIPFRDADNTLHSLTADQVIEMVNAGKQKASLIYQTAWDMKDGTGDFTGGIPADYTDSSYWTD